MSESVTLIYSDDYQGYRFSPWHPMKPVRLLLTAELIRAYGIDRLPNCGFTGPRPASDEELELIHDPVYIGKVRELSEPGAEESSGWSWGLGTGDNPVFPRMHESSALIAGGALTAAEKIMSGELDHAFHVAGGLHHAQRARASGFCIYNDVAIAIAWLRQQGIRVVYIDIDAHHGDGVQNAFYGDSEVMTISFHESGRSLFPGTGYTGDIGEGRARGTSINLPLAPHTGDDLFLKAFDELVPPLTRAFRPDVVVTQNGCDGHFDDPLTHLSLTLEGYAKIWARMHDLSHEVTAGRWLASGGGGYQAFTVVPCAWTLLMAELAGTRLAEEIPESWRELCERHSGAQAPRFLTRESPPPPGPGAHEIARQAVEDGTAEIKSKIFPLMGAAEKQGP
ncbi:MAG: acetoin utilization protein AcuC [Thermoleophilia bacterium]|nr:acetoin utilization protein AcuC [Thermoleophilia bacterium]